MKYKIRPFTKVRGKSWESRPRETQVKDQLREVTIDLNLLRKKNVNTKITTTDQGGEEVAMVQTLVQKKNVRTGYDDR
jgi:hypothetical protein